MKWLVVFAVVAAAGCDSDVIGGAEAPAGVGGKADGLDGEIAEHEYGGPPCPATFDDDAELLPSPKKGVGVWFYEPTADGGTTCASMQHARVSWYYDWEHRFTSSSVVEGIEEVAALGLDLGPDPVDAVRLNFTIRAPADAEFVPMLHRSEDVTDAALDEIEALDARYLLGMNEPDDIFAAPRNPGEERALQRDVEEALDAWEVLTDWNRSLPPPSRLLLGSPAVAGVAHEEGLWLDRFMRGVQERGLQVDFIAVHWYGGQGGDDRVAKNLRDFEAYLQRTHDRYGLPIWVTEYALIDWQGWPVIRYPTERVQASFARRSVPLLESLPFVERYAWYALPWLDAREGETDVGPDGISHNLYDEQGRPTRVGKQYAFAGLVPVEDD